MRCSGSQDDAFKNAATHDNEAAFLHRHAKAFVRCRFLSSHALSGSKKTPIGLAANPREESCFLPYTPLPSCSPITQRHAARRSAGCCFIHSASCGAPIRQDCIETSAKSEVVTVCSWQFAGKERLQSTAMILITTGEPHRYDGYWRR